MRHIALSSVLIVLFSTAGFLVVDTFSPTKAEVGPCRIHQRGGLICGEGAGAARVVGETISPSKRLAFAWRSPDRPPTEQPDEGAVESLLIRLSDGATLWRAKGIYWDIGTMHANRSNVATAWSPNSRFVVETTDVRWWTHALRLFVIEATDTVLVLDLKTIIEPVVRKYIPRVVKYGDFAVFGSADGERPRLTLDDRGLINALVLVSMPKHDPYVAAMLDVTFQAFHRNGELGARKVSVHRSRNTPN